ncbi:immunoglobulin-like domain-containing protein, partial [Poseidonibacter sp.]|uniref:immunoglobulin-like domain-containing protein n=1 Tax=Poseidonibacter sp. TaxID=2321188 RepID=UPI003C77C4D6
KEAPNYESEKKSYTLNVIATDNGGVKLSDTQILTININDVNDDPVIQISESITTNEDNSKDLVFTYEDEDENVVTAVEKTKPSYGIIAIDATTIKYTPTLDYNGNDSFEITLSDGNGYTIDKTINVIVNAVDDAPVITTVLEDKTVNEDARELVIDLKDLTTTDVDNDVNTQKPTYAVKSSNEKIATAYIQDEQLIVKPVNRANGVVEISVTTTVNGKSSTKIFKYTILSVNNAPTIPEFTDVLHEQSPSVIEKTIEFTISDDGEIDEVKAQSSNTNLISNDNLIVKQLDGNASLSYTISANNAGNTTITVVVKDTEGEEVEKSFNVNVKAANDQLCVENTKTALTFDTIKNENSSQDAVTSSLTLVDTIESICASTITWSSSEVNNPVLNINDGSVTPPTSENKTITIKANIKKGLFTANKSFLITVPTNALSDEEVIKMINFDNMRNKNTRKSEITSTLTLPTTLLNKTIVWTSNNDNVISPFSGYVTRLQEDTEVVLTATIGNETKEFKLKVLKQETSNEEIVKKDTQMLTIESILGKNIDANNVIYDLEDLPSEGVNGSIISWS